MEAKILAASNPSPQALAGLGALFDVDLQSYGEVKLSPLEQILKLKKKGVCVDDMFYITVLVRMSFTEITNTRNWFTNLRCVVLEETNSEELRAYSGSISDWKLSCSRGFPSSTFAHIKNWSDV